MSTDAILDHELQARSHQILKDSRHDMYVTTDRMFAVLLVLEWISAIVAAVTLSPLNWEGHRAGIHIHVWAALFLGGMIVAMPLYLVATKPGRSITRHTIAIAQMTYSALFIHLAGGRLEAHFHIFGSLAFLSFYRDWKVLLTASAVVSLDHWLRGWLWPQSVFGVPYSQPWRWIEHAAWVIFEDIFLFMQCFSQQDVLKRNAERQANLEFSSALIEKQYGELKEQKEAERRISEFCSTVSHELRTPLTSIRAALSLIDSGVIDGGSVEAKDLIGIAHSSSVRLVRLINDILDLRKIEAGAMELSLAEVSCNSLTKEAVHTMAAAAAQKNIVIEVSSCSRKIVADQDRLIQVLTNLLSNAVKFSPENSSMKLTAKPGAEGFIRFSVVDNGQGIPEDQQHKLFGRFQQVDSSDTRAKEGSGLGLAISKAIVEQHGGTMGFESEPGKGSTFFFEIPCAAERCDTHPMTVIDNNLPTVLIVEDDLATRKLLQVALESQGYRVELAESKSSAISALARMVPHAILLDINLPDGSGLDIVEYVREKDFCKSTPIIIVSADSSKCSFSRPVIFDIVNKPFEPKDLLQTLHRAMKDFRHKRVLLIDDDAQLTRIMESQLKQLDVECKVASDGIEALWLAKRLQPDLIVLDVNMPFMDGFQVVNYLKEAQLSTPLLVYTGRDLTAAEREHLTLGITKHMTKGNVSSEELVSAVRDLVGTIAPSSQSLAHSQTEQVA